MAERWERHLRRWVDAGVMEAATAERIRAWEAQQAESRGLRWPVVLAVSFGAILLAAGILLFVAAHWDDISPAARFSLVLLMVAVFHVAGALLAERFAVLSTALHAAGTACLGAGIFLAGQIFHLQEHWPAALMLWALGAWVGWALLRDWPQATLAALLTPAWLAGEWIVATERMEQSNVMLSEGLFLVALVYFTAQRPGQENTTRRALFIIGGLALIPCTIYLLVALDRTIPWYGSYVPFPTPLAVVGYAGALALPVALGCWLRRAQGWTYPVAALWVAILGTMDLAEKYPQLSIFLWCAVGGAGLAAWGVRDARREIERLGLLGLFAAVCALLGWAHEYEALWIYPLCVAIAVGIVAWGVKVTQTDGINLGVATFAVTVGFFYFSTVMDKLGRSASMIGLGLLFLLGGWALEKTRRRLVAHVRENKP